MRPDQGATARRHLRIPALWWPGIAIPIASAAAILATDARRLGAADVSALTWAQLAAQVLMTETTLLVVGAPLAGVFSVTRARLSRAEWSQRSAATTLSGAWQIARPLTAGVSVLVVTSVVVAFALQGPVDPRTLSMSHVVLWAATLAFAALGALCAAVLREPLDAAAWALSIALVSGVGLFAAGPALDEVPRRVLNAVLVANPIVATAASADIDIFRIHPLYQLSPLAHTQFDYPTPAAAFAWYGLIATLLFVGTARHLGRRMSSLSV